DFLNLGGIVSYVPARFVRLRPIVRRVPVVLTEEAILKLIVACRTPREKALIELLYGTGCRISELTTIRLERIDFKARTIHVTGKGRTRVVLFGLHAEKA